MDHRQGSSYTESAFSKMKKRLKVIFPINFTEVLKQGNLKKIEVVSALNHFSMLPLVSTSTSWATNLFLIMLR